MKIKRTKDRISYFEGEKELAYVLFPKIDDHTVVIQSTYVDPILRGARYSKSFVRRSLYYYKRLTL